MVQTVRSNDNIKVLTVRTSAFAAAELFGSAPISEIASVEVNNLSTHLKYHIEIRIRPDLTTAKIIVSGGRGVGSEGNFSLIYDLADRLNAAVGATGAAVDSGYAANDLQVGQNGKIVVPDLYIAVGISGAIQHLAGMKDSKVIIAINNDPDAPIFQVADYGLVADLFNSVPDLIRTL